MHHSRESQLSTGQRRDCRGVTNRQKGLADIGHQSHMRSGTSGPTMGCWAFPTLCLHTQQVSAVLLLLQGPQGRPSGRG